MIDKGFWRGRRVFVTGHTGFKGSWLCLLLNELGSKVKGFALDAPTNPSLFKEARIAEFADSEIGDIRDFESLFQSIHNFQPDVLIHMAAQPLVRYSYVAPIETYAINVLGTANVLEAAKMCGSIKSVVCVTTDKCYENREWLWPYRETEPMGGHDPYSASKGCAELVTASYRKSYYLEKAIGLASARAGNVIGGGDWASDRLIPDILRAFENNQPVVIRSPNAIRPWQHVLEPLSGYLMLAERLYKKFDGFDEGWNFGPYEDDAKPVNWVLDRMVEAWPETSWELDMTVGNPHEANFLKLDISKARTKLNWKPTWKLDQTLVRIVNWHRAWLSNCDMQEYSKKEIKEFMNFEEHSKDG